MDGWQFTKLEQRADGWHVLTKPLGNPVDALARRAMKTTETFAGLSLADAKKRGAEFEAWRIANESG